MVVVRVSGMLWPGSLRLLRRTITTGSLSSRLVTLQDRWQQFKHIQTDLLETGFTHEAMAISAIPEKHRLLHGSYTALLKSVIKNEKSCTKDVILVFDSICARYRPSKSDLMLMIEWFRNNRDPDNAIKILQTMFHSGCPLEPIACNQVINVVATESGSQAASKLIDRLISIGFKPDHYTYASMINASAIERNVVLAEHWFQQYLEHDEAKDNVVVYGALMKAYLRAELLEKCTALLDGSASVQPNVFMYTTAIEAYRRSNQADRCIELYGSMIDRGLSPTIRTYNQLIDATSSTGDIESSMKFYEDMKSRGLSPDIMTFTSILKGHLIEIETGAKLTCTSPSQHRSKLSSVSRSLLSEATLKYGVVPDLAMYTTLVNIFTLTGHLTDALLCVVDMMVTGIKPDLKLLGAILSCLSHHGSYHQCRNLYGTMLRCGIAPNLYCYQAIISSLRNHQSLAGDTLYYLEEIRARDVIPDVKLYCTIMQVLGRANQVRLSAKVFIEASRYHNDFSTQDWCAIIIAAIQFLPNPGSKSRFWQKIHPALPFEKHSYTDDLNNITQSLNTNENKR